MDFKDLREMLAPETLPLPIGGIIYHIEQCTAEDWLWMHSRGEQLDVALRLGKYDEPAEGEGTSQVEFYQRTLGEQFGKMVADGVKGQELMIAAYTSFFWHLGNREYAEQIWAAVGKAPKALTATSEEVNKFLADQNRAARRAKPATPRATSASRKTKTTRASSARTGAAPRGTKSSATGR